jgi:hypothetical protein
MAGAQFFVLLTGIGALSGAARADVNLYVSAGAAPGGNGSAAAPYRRITDAGAAARTLRTSPSENRGTAVVVWVAPGQYVGSSDWATLARNPALEPLPIILDVPDLALAGATVLAPDAAGFPAEVVTGTETTLTSREGVSGAQALLVVGPTSADVTGRNVTVRGLILDGGNGGKSIDGIDLILDRAQGFAIQATVITGAADVGIRGRASSGTVEASLMTGVGLGAGLGGGNSSWPAHVVVRNNRAVANVEGGALLAGSGVPILAPMLLPVAPGTMFDSLTGEVTGNDLSNNAQDPNLSFGLRLFQLVPQMPAGQSSGSLTVAVSGNRIVNNSFGITIDAGFPYRDDPRLWSGTFHGSFSGNMVAGNRLASAFITFARFPAVIGGDSSSLKTFKYLQDSTFALSYTGGELDGFWFDNPSTDPVDGRSLDNTLIVNGVPLSGRNFK